MKPILVDLPFQFSTPRLIMRVPKAGDGKGVYEAISDGYSDYIKWLNWPKTIPTLEEVEIECRKHHASFILREDIRFLIINKQTQEIMGRCGLPALQINWQIPLFGLSYFIAKRFRGNGYALEAINGLSHLIFKVLKARKLEIKVDPDNIASKKVPEKLGFIVEAKQKGNWLRKDKVGLTDIWTYALFDPLKLPFLDVRW